MWPKIQVLRWFSIFKMFIFSIDLFLTSTEGQWHNNLNISLECHEHYAKQDKTCFLKTHSQKWFMLTQNLHMYTRMYASKSVPTKQSNKSKKQLLFRTLKIWLWHNIKLMVDCYTYHLNIILQYYHLFFLRNAVRIDFKITFTKYSPHPRLVRQYR